MQTSRMLSNISHSFCRMKFHQFRRMNCTTAKSLHYEEYGEPVNVLQMIDSTIAQPAENEVTVKWLLSPVNPADINTIQGKYPSKPPLPAVPGNEGVGEIVAIGDKVENVKVGDKVLPNGLNFGIWRTIANYTCTDVMPIPKDVGLVEASMLNVNPCTAFRMLRDFVDLKPGNCVIQNGGNSAVGQLVIQLCKTWNYKNVSIVRDRPDIEELKNHLKSLGATEVLTEAELRSTDIFKRNKVPQPKLALNCVSGQNALEVLRHLAHGGVMVTYGGMSREPVTVPTSSLIFKDLTIKGFWMSAWTKKNINSDERKNMFNEILDLFKNNKIQSPPHKLVPFDQYKEAILNTLSVNGKAGVKYILDMRNI